MYLLKVGEVVQDEDVEEVVQHDNVLCQKKIRKKDDGERKELIPEIKI